MELYFQVAYRHSDPMISWRFTYTHDGVVWDFSLALSLLCFTLFMLLISACGVWAGVKLETTFSASLRWGECDLLFLEDRYSWF